MSFILKTFNNPQKELLSQIFSHFELSDHKDSSCFEMDKSEDIEKQLLDNIIIRAIEKKTRLHILYDQRDIQNPIPCGLIALNFELIGNFAALCIDFIFISKNYRGIYFPAIDSKISNYLLSFALQESIQMNEISKLDAVILSPINECVSKVYQEFGFEEFGDGWLYFYIDDII